MDGKRKKIIIADESRTFIMYMNILLKRMGYEVLSADSTMEALRMLKLEEADLLIMDTTIENHKGMEVLTGVKNDPEIKSTPVVMVSIDGTEETQQKCYDLGCSGYLTKPIKIDELHHALQQALYRPEGSVRQYLRAPFWTVVSVKPEAGSEKPTDHHSVTLSEGGIYLRSQAPYSVGTRLSLSFALGDDDGERMNLVGTVIYTLAKDDLHSNNLPVGMAIEFEGVPESTAKTLHDFIQNRLRANGDK